MAATRFAILVLLAFTLPSLLHAASTRKKHTHAQLHTHSVAIPNISQLQLNLQAQLELSVTPTQLTGEAQQVTISWSGNVFGQVNDWIAAYSPIPDGELGFQATLPVKYMNLTSLPGTSGSIQMWLLHMRAPWVFAYMQGGFESPTIIALSNQVTYDPAPEQYNLPMQIHLVRTVDPSQMLIVWVTTNETQPVLMYASSQGLLSDDPWVISGQTSTYTRDQMCGGLAATIGWRDPGSIHHALLGDLQPGQQYWYQVASQSSGAVSAIYNFVAPPAPTKDIDFFIFGDMGQAEFDGTIEWEEWTTVQGTVMGDIDQPPAINTTASIRNDLLDGSVDNSTAIVLIIGDVSYARGREAMWDQFHYLLQPISSAVPVMTLLGNHELNWNYTYWPGTDSGGECGVAHQARFPMPSPPRSSPPSKQQGFSATPWYSFAHGAVHFVMLSSEHNFTTGCEQWLWLQQDLQQVDRTVTPWIVMAAHRPMYVSSTNSGSPDSDMAVAALMRLHLEPLMHEYEVDAFFAGHHHDYQRSCAVFNETCVQGSEKHPHQHVLLGEDTGRDFALEPQGEAPSFGTVHTVTGAAGQWNNVFLDPTPLPWLEFANEKVHGYTRVKVRGNQMTLEFVASNDRSIWDSVTITKGDKKANRPTQVRRNKSKTFQPHRAAMEERAIQIQEE